MNTGEENISFLLVRDFPFLLREVLVVIIRSLRVA